MLKIHAGELKNILNWNNELNIKEAGNNLFKDGIKIPQIPTQQPNTESIRRYRTSDLKQALISKSQEELPPSTTILAPIRTRSVSVDSQKKPQILL